MHFSLLFLTVQALSVQAELLSGSKGCVSKGLQYAVFNNPYPRNSAYNYVSFDPTYMKAPSAGGNGTQNVYYSSTTGMAGGLNSSNVNGNTVSIYGSSYKVPLWNFAVSHRGYIKASAPGAYTFQFSNIDDIVLIWTGTNAKTGWTRGNADAVAYWNQPSPGQTSGQGSATAKYTLAKGQYLPFRIIYANGGGPFAFDVTVTNPKGATILGSSSKPNSGVEIQSCSNNKAPMFPYAFGQEQ